jgi:hypothetical protein
VAAEREEEEEAGSAEEEGGSEINKFGVRACVYRDRLMWRERVRASSRGKK